MATRWGIAGAGKISHDFVTALRTLSSDEHNVMAIAAQNLGRAEAFSKLHKIDKFYEGYDNLAQDEDVDVVYIGTLNRQHFDIAKTMLEHGKHVLCEKPLTMNLKQTTQLINLAKMKNRFLMEAVWSRCFPAYDSVKEAIKSGSIGDVYQVIVCFGFNMAHVDRLNQKQLGGGTILDLGVYGLQFASFIFGNEMPNDIRAAGFLNDDGVDISVSATMLYEGSRTATILTHSLVDLPNEAYVIGTRGTIKIPNFWCPTSVHLPSGIVNQPPLPPGSRAFNFINSAGLRYEAAEVRDCLMRGAIESSKVSHSLSLLLASLEDELRRQVGVVYDED